MPKPRQLPGRTLRQHTDTFSKGLYFLAVPPTCIGNSRALYLSKIKTMKSQTLQYYMHDGPSAFRFELAGDLNNEGASRLQQDWRTASSVISGRALIVDMTFVTSAEEDGRALLARWYAAGAQVIAKSKVSRELAEAIVGEPLPESRAAGNAGVEGTWLPVHTFLVAPKLHLTLLLAALLLPMQSDAANLKSETVTAWDDYVQSLTATLQDRARPGGIFLWTYENSERIAKVHNGGIVVAPAPGPTPRKVPGGLIHHWIGAAFLPNTKLDDILEVTHDYDRYKEFYRPSVIESRAVARKASDDEFWMLLMNKAFFLETALDADYQATDVRVDERRFYTVSRATRVQEIKDYGRPSQYRMPEGEGGGYIWKLFSIVRLEQSDGGVYVEIEAIVLSRDIPGAVHLVVDPIVRRVARNSMLTSIKQTGEAVRSNSLANMKPANSSASAEHLSSASAALKDKASAFARVR
jgi:hypothetical protein